jgi:dnd system-associated protein 4
MRKEPLFTKDHAVRWPDKYEGVVNFLKYGVDQDTRHKNDSLYSLNVHVIVFAACVGLKNDTELPIGEAKTIDVSTFRGQALEPYLYLIPLLSQKDPDLYMLRDEAGEKRAIDIFERYTAGGLSILADVHKGAGLRSPELLITSYLQRETWLGDRGDGNPVSGIVDDIF